MGSEALYSIALSRVPYLPLPALVQLFHEVGSATRIMEYRQDIRQVLPEASPMLVNTLRDMDDLLRRADDELKYNEANNIKTLTLTDPAYPQRLAECADAPIVLFYKGTADLNQQRIISIVGTRHSTPYGHDLVRRFMADLRQQCPQVLIVSGLAYGIDICAHRCALEQHYETVGVLAHGLDDLYPSMHRQTATEMTRQGGLLTEFTTMTNADKRNFVRRNRIVAGMADATILVESAAKGGGLITCSIARSYDRDVFAFPGAVGQPYSEGCNNLIRDNGAALITSAADFVKAMGWEDDAARQQMLRQGVERQLFPALSQEEQRVVDALTRQNDQQVNLLAVQSNIPIGQLTAILFSLEMKGVVRPQAGGSYHLLNI